MIVVTGCRRGQAKGEATDFGGPVYKSRGDDCGSEFRVWEVGFLGNRF